jgi:DtxR family Mn-dependent transcriptional regulator
MPTPGAEEYLEAIYVLTVEGREPQAARVAEYLGVSAVSVSRALDRMQRDGWVAERHPAIKLTPDGLREAEAVVRRHRLAERWLADRLGLNWIEAHREAERLEHAISARVEEALWRDLGMPRTCPHGNPIPGLAGDLVEAAPLSTVPSGTYVVERVFEQLEGLEDLLRRLFDLGLVPGRQVEVRDPRDDGHVTVTVAGRTERLERHVADKILVRLTEFVP